MNGENNGKPYEEMMIWGVLPPLFLEILRDFSLHLYWLGVSPANSGK